MLSSFIVIIIIIIIIIIVIIIVIIIIIIIIIILITVLEKVELWFLLKKEILISANSQLRGVINRLYDPVFLLILRYKRDFFLGRGGGGRCGGGDWSPI